MVEALGGFVEQALDFAGVVMLAFSDAPDDALEAGLLLLHLFVVVGLVPGRGARGRLHSQAVERLKLFYHLGLQHQRQPHGAGHAGIGDESAGRGGIGAGLGFRGFRLALDGERDLQPRLRQPAKEGDLPLEQGPRPVGLGICRGGGRAEHLEQIMNDKF